MNWRLNVPLNALSDVRVFNPNANTGGGFQAMVERAARAAGFDMKIHPHMLRHSCGYKLANDGVDMRTI